MTIWRIVGDSHYHLYGHTHYDFEEWIRVTYKICDPFQYVPLSEQGRKLVYDRDSQKVRLVS